MSHRCHQLVDVNTLKENDSPQAIPVQSNGMYNNPRYSGVGETPFQLATQTVYSFAENVTNKHPIFKVVAKNKICSQHCHLLDEGTVDHHCSPGVCGANLLMHHTIGDEFTWAREGMADELLCKDGLQVSEVITDPDSSAFRAANSSTRTVCYKRSLCAYFIEMCHLSKTILESRIKNTELSLRSCKTLLHYNFALDAVYSISFTLAKSQILLIFTLADLF